MGGCQSTGNALNTCRCVLYFVFLLQGLFIVFVCGHQIHHVATNGEGLFWSACGLEGDASWGALPGGHGTGGIGWSVFCFGLGHACAVQEFLENRLAAADLSDDGEEFLAVFGDAAIGSVVAVPTGDGVEGVKLGKIDGRNVAGDAVDKQSGRVHASRSGSGTAVRRCGR
jgi:hypothetical protein